MRRSSRRAASWPPPSPPGGRLPGPARQAAGRRLVSAPPRTLPLRIRSSRARPWTAGWRPWPAATRSPSARWSRRWAGACPPALAAWWPAFRPRCCAASSTRPGCPPGAWTARSWTATCRWGRCGGAGPGTARRALAERDGRWLLAWRLGWTFACTTHASCSTPARPAGRPPAAAPAAPGSPPGSCANTIKLTQVLRRRPAPGDPGPALRARQSGAGRPAVDWHPAHAR